MCRSVTWKRPTFDWVPAVIVVVEVAGVAAYALVAAGAERLAALAGEDDHADVGVLARILQRVGDLDHGARTERVSDLGPSDRDLRDALVGAARLLVADVREVAAGGGRRGDPGDAHRAKASLCAMEVEAWLARAAATQPERTALADTRGGLVLRPAARRCAVRRGRADRARGRARRARGDRAPRRARVRAGAARMPAARRGRSTCRPAPRAGRARADRGGRRRARRAAAGGGARAGETSRGRHARARRRRRRDPHVGHDISATAGRADLRQLPVERARLGRRAGSRSQRALAVRAAAVACRRAVDPAALGDLRNDRRGARALRGGPRAAGARASSA